MISFGGIFQITHAKILIAFLHTLVLVIMLIIFHTIFLTFEKYFELILMSPGHV